MAGSRLQRLDARYRAHQDSRTEFVFGADDRAELIARLVGGPRLDVLDLGCRTGALTRYYAADNHVVGVDVDHEALERAQERLDIETTMRVEIGYAVGRYVRFHPRLMARVQVFKAELPAVGG